MHQVDKVISSRLAYVSYNTAQKDAAGLKEAVADILKA